MEFMWLIGLIVIIFSGLSEEVKVDTTLGIIEGVQEKSSHGDNFYSFLGVPYAEAPIGDLRFKPPVSKKRWDGILPATKAGKVRIISLSCLKIKNIFSQ